MERQCKTEFKTDPSQFMLLYKDAFSDVYRYVARRVEDEEIRKKIVELAFLDAFGQMEACPLDVSFVSWLYRLAWVRVEEYVGKAVVGPAPEINSPIFDGATVMDGVYDDEYTVKRQAETFFAQLTLQEREVIKLKFFEEITDGEVMYVLGIEEGVIGPMIYKVLKRGYEILYGKVEDNRGVYYGELHGFLARLKRIEKVPVPDDLNLELNLNLQKKVDAMVMGKFGGASEASEGVASSTSAGSDDPAKVFVQAAKGLTREEADQMTEEYVRDRSVGNVPSEKPVNISIDEPILPAENIPVNYVEEDSGLMSDGREMFRYLLSLVPSLLFVFAVCVVVAVVVFGRVKDEGVTGLPYLVDYEDGFESFDKDFEKMSDYGLRVVIEDNLIAKIDDGKAIDHAEVRKVSEELTVDLRLEGEGWLEYKFDILEDDEFKVRSYKKFE